MADDKPKSENNSSATWQRWHDELEAAGKARWYDTWQKRGQRIIKRYRDERANFDNASEDAEDGISGGAKFNILWSNVQTLKPALFAKTPKPVVERRYLDRDEVGRTAAVILERSLLYELDEGGYKAAVEKAVMDRLLPGRGVVWERYEPKFSPIQTTGTAKAGGDAETGDETLADPDQTEEGEEVASESTCTDYVDWTDFTTSPARTWEEVWWIDRRVYMTRQQGVKRFGAKFKDVPLDWSPNKQLAKTPLPNQETGDNEGQKRATIHETWCKTDRKVYWWAKMWPDDMLDEKDDPLKLEGFWPVPKPLYATLTNDSLIPVPDYYEYQDQAAELDDLTNRISWLTKSIKSAGCYDASIPELQRLFEEGFENRLVPVDNMAEFMQKAGPSGMGHIWLLPVVDQSKVLADLFTARDQVKQSLYEITGISDIVRGAAAAGGAKTATEQRIKGQFASMRLNDMQAEVARFCRDTLRIKGEIIAEHFDPETLRLVSGFDQYAKEQWPPETPTPPAPGQQVMGGNGPPPGPMPGQAPVAPQMGMPPGIAMPSIDPVAVAKAKADQMFSAAVALLRNDKLRGFRIDIETDSIVEPDQQAMQQARTELLGAIAQFLPQAIQAGMAMPELKPLLARLLMFFLRGFKASRDIESAFEQFVDDMTKEAANPKQKPPSPEEIKAKAEMQKQEMENQRIAMQAKIDQQQAQADFMLEQAKAKMEIEREQMKLQLERERLNMEREKMNMQLAGEQQKAAIQGAAAERQAAVDERASELDVRGMERKHVLGLETMEAKAAQAKANGAAEK